ncbi:helix-turn-helix domain-containing protein [Natrialbaceae archaeon AArc-T1-2]|uniref:helix-turn-helix domain-containing protein n=1 Tax=Natrialbaceae archaeon AArc-T1-2 TaxID=3053904 RepID=UPI00255AAF9D|nr:helix-turn-helix domain-containing protein [Natrialbaceae archaeon AArc-T1-2]WIV68601.1 helix-turn-helix domain-containing protein [Natrialbaceae archaeon AArc-T1-2]
METTSSEQTVVPVNVDTLTAKQREVVLLALEHGYYETPRRTTLGELADKLDISSSAASQRLNAAERTLIRETFGRFVQK